MKELGVREREKDCQGKKAFWQSSSNPNGCTRAEDVMSNTPLRLSLTLSSLLLSLQQFVLVPRKQLVCVCVGGWMRLMCLLECVLHA